MQNKKTIIYAVVGVIVLVGVFYGGMVYEKSQASKLATSRFGVNMQNRNNISGNNRINAGGFIVGEIISKDDKSITVKLTDGGSKIIFLSTDLEIAKTASGSINDLTIGTQISTNGATNSDGSITVKNIQIRPQLKNTIPSQ